MRPSVPGIVCWWLVLWLCDGVAADPCYPPGGVAGIVVATVVVTCVVGGLGAALVYRYWWSPRHASKGSSTQNRTHQGGPAQKSSGDFAFDNPYFRNQEGDEADGTDRAKNKFSSNKNSLRSSKLSESGAPRSGRRGVKNPFGGGAGKKQKALDDSCITSHEPERTVVQLRGKDFTGLGFNICGNMRDGIHVKDVLHRGPASESGLIRAGDKILSITVSFANIVYEDALTILSYASPYDVQLELERSSDLSTRSRMQLSSASGQSSKRLGSCSFSSSGQKLFHPLYRSQSIDDLTQIDSGFPSAHGPRRSQSVGVAAHKLVSSQFFKGSPSCKDDASASSKVAMALNATGSLNEKMLANVMSDGTSQGLKWKKQFEDTLESDDSAKDRTENSAGGSTTSTFDNAASKSAISVKDSSSNFRNSSRLSRNAPNSNDEPDAGKSASRHKEGTNASEYKAEHVRKGDASRRDAGLSNYSNSSRGVDETLYNKNMSPDNPPPRVKRSGGEDENDSDVSRDSLELVTKRYYQRRRSSQPPFSPGDDHPRTGTPKADQPNQQDYPSKSDQTSVSRPSVPAAESQSARFRPDRAHGNERTNPSNRQGSESVSVMEVHQTEKERSNYARSVSDSNDIRNSADDYSHSARDSRSASKLSSNAHEKQKLNAADAFNYDYGCTNRFGNGSVQQEFKGSRTILVNSKCPHPSALLSTYPAEERNHRPEMVEHQKVLPESVVPLPQQKFSKKSPAPNPAGGMFTQISPFQIPSKQKNLYKSWASGREEESSAKFAAPPGAGISMSSTSSRHSFAGGPPDPSVKFSITDGSTKHRQF